jgi:CheY-like chemotaxis protein
MSGDLPPSEAVKKMLSGDFDVLVCDVMMSGADGVEIYEALKTPSPGMEARVVFLAGGTFTDRARQFLAMSQNQVVAKPIEVDKLRVAVKGASEA